MFKHAREIMGEMAERLDREAFEKMAKRPETTMAEEQDQPEASASDDIDWYSNALRNHSPEAIQKALAKALLELTGKKYETHIMRLDFAPEWAGAMAAMSGDAEILLRVSRPRWHPRDDEPVTPS